MGDQIPIFIHGYVSENPLNENFEAPTPVLYVVTFLGFRCSIDTIPMIHTCIFIAPM